MLHGLVATFWFAGSMLQTHQSPNVPPARLFTDVKRGHWLYSETGRLTRQRVAGWPDPSFFRRTWTRYEFAVGLDRALKSLGSHGDGKRHPPLQAGSQVKRLDELSAADLGALVRIRRELREEIAELVPPKELRSYDGMLARALTSAKARECRPAQLQSGSLTRLNDVDQNHWAFPILTHLQKLELIKGYPDNVYRGNRAMTRYEVSTVLSELTSRHPNLRGPARTEESAKP